jgi:hypothetical protein
VLLIVDYNSRFVSFMHQIIDLVRYILQIEIKKHSSQFWCRAVLTAIQMKTVMSS